MRKTRSLFGRDQRDPNHSPVIDAVSWSDLPLHEGEDVGLVLRRTVPLAHRALTDSGWIDRALGAAVPLAIVAACSLIAHAAKPYGPGSLPDLKSMLKADALDCSNFGLLTHHFVRLYDSALADVIEFQFVGWESKAIGNHQVVFVRQRDRPGTSLLLDPTTGVVCAADFDEVASGTPVAPSRIVAFAQKPALDGARQAMVLALVSGAIRPSEMLYYFENVDRLLHFFGHPSTWPTPGAAAWRLNHPS